MKMYTIKNKKAFTLIELLAIIVILGIIAVITVPIILDSIKKAKIGAAEASAYGYKDTINKFYVSSVTDSQETIDNGIYTVEQLKDLGVSANGEEPTSDSWILISKSEVVQGCLQFDDYKVEIENGKVSNTEIGECQIHTIPSCPGCVFKYTYWEKYFKGTPDTNVEETTLNNYVYDYTEIERKVFLGYILDENERIERAFACAIHDNGTPFCIEGTTDASRNASNEELLNSEELWNGTCEESGGTYCGGDTVAVRSYTSGKAETYETYEYEDGDIYEYSCSTYSVEQHAIVCKEELWTPGH